MTDVTNIASFIASYDLADESRIAFAWNRKHAADLQDVNLDFRRAVVKEVLARPEGASVELLRALVDAETALAKEAWGTTLWVHTLAELLLIRGGVEYVKDFLEFWYRGMDAHLELSRISLSRELNATFEAHCAERLASAQTQRDRLLYEEGVRLFSALASRAAEKAG